MGASRVSPRARLAALHGLLVSLCLLGIGGAALVAVREPLWGVDYVSIWGLKGRALQRSGELLSLVRVDPLHSFAHPEYPPLWPLVLSATASLQGGWDDLLLSPLWPALCLASSLLAFRATRGSLAARLAAGAAVSLLPFWRVPYHPGYAEALLVVFVLAALGEVHRLSRPAPLARFAVSLVLASLTKNEGVLVAGAAALALVASAARAPDPASRRILARAAIVGLLAPVLLAVVPWQIWLARHLPPGGGTDFSLSDFAPEKALRVGLLLGEYVLVAGWAWLAGVIVLLMLAPGVREQRAGVLLACALYVGAFSGAFAFTRYDPVWHIATSWGRLIFIPAAVLAVVLAEAASEALARPLATPDQPAGESPA